MHQESTKISEISRKKDTLSFNYIIIWISEVGNKGKDFQTEGLNE